MEVVVVIDLQFFSHLDLVAGLGLLVMDMRMITSVLTIDMVGEMVVGAIRDC